MPLSEDQIKTAFLGNLTGRLLSGGAKAIWGLGKGLAGGLMRAGGGAVGLAGNGVAHGVGSAIGSGVNATARGLGRGAWEVGRGALGFGASAGAGLGGKALATAGGVGMAALPIASAMSAGPHDPGRTSPTLALAGMNIYGSADVDPLLYKTASKLAYLQPADLADIGSYGAFIASKMVDPSRHPKLHTALDAAGLLGLGATTAYGMLHNHGEHKPGAKDLAGLALMASALYDRTKDHG